MLHQLTSENYYRVQSLFHDQSKHHLFCAGVLAGKYAGQVLVTDLERPQTALVRKGATWCYLGGNPHHDAFNNALRTELVERHLIDKNLGALLITISSEEWRYLLDTLVAELVVLCTQDIFRPHLTFMTGC